MTWLGRGRRAAPTALSRFRSSFRLICHHMSSHHPTRQLFSSEHTHANIELQGPFCVFTWLSKLKKPMCVFPIVRNTRKRCLHGATWLKRWCSVCRKCSSTPIYFIVNRHPPSISLNFHKPKTITRPECNPNDL